MRALPLAALLVLAGCITAPEVDVTPTPTPDVAGARTIPWTLLDCEYVVGWSTADSEALQARLPEGFSVAVGSLLPGGIVGPASATLGTEAFNCASGAGLEGELDAMTYGSIWFGVIPSEEYAVEGVEQYYWKENILVPDEARRAAFEALGAPVHAGDAAQSASRGPFGSAATLALEDFGDFDLSLEAPQASPAPEGAEFVEIAPTADGRLIVWHANYTWTEGEPYTRGRGTIEWPAGTWAADAVGSASAPGMFHAGRWSFNGTIALPAG